MSEQRAADGQLGTVTGGTSWVEWYRDMSSLKAASDAVVAGKIDEVRSVTASRREPHWHTITDYTDFIFTVRERIWDPRNIAAEAWIIIHQTGGVWEDLRFELGDDPLFQVGEEALLFLRQWAPRRFFVAGGPTGRFAVHAGLIMPATAGGVPVAAETTLGDFAASIRAA
jgi:hypothetical protein